MNMFEVDVWHAAIGSLGFHGVGKGRSFVDHLTQSFDLTPVRLNRRTANFQTRTTRRLRAAMTDRSTRPCTIETRALGCFQALGRRTPTLLPPFTCGNRSRAAQVAWVRNLALWQVTPNHARFMRGRAALDNHLRDRDFVGLADSRNF